MSGTTELTAEEIRVSEDERRGMRPRDLAETLGISEAELVAARCGDGATRIDPHPDAVIGAAQGLGEVMALTRNADCVHEKVGRYDRYHPGEHAAMVLTEEIDLRIFPSHWRHAFMVERRFDDAIRRSLQVFDAAGDAVHKIILREGSDLAAWDAARSALASDSQVPACVVEARQPVEAPKSEPAKLAILRKEWARLTDTHQFLRLTAKLKMNRLGAYRIAGAPFVRALEPSSASTVLERVREAGIEVMIFVGNRGCIQIHTGRIDRVAAMGPWQNVMDPRFNLHLRADRVAEVWAVEKPTQRGPALSVEAFDADGGLVFQVFGVGKEGRDSRADWATIVAGLASLETAVTA